MKFRAEFLPMTRRLAWPAALLALLFFTVAGIGRAQESSSRPGDANGERTNLPSSPTAKNRPASIAPMGKPTAPNGPSAALRDVLLAACAQDAGGFSRFLTTRSKESFERMSPAARVALMKRFVLLNVPGKATQEANPAGRPIVRCETPDVTTEMSIGGADVRDNLAFMPLELRDANDSSGENVHQINMGLVLEKGQWRLLSLGLLLLDLPSLEVEWDTAEANANESSALENGRKLAEAVETYRRTYTSLPESLTNLGPVSPVASARGVPGKTASATRENAGLVDGDLAAGNKDGYEFRIIIAGASTLGAPAKYELSATPSVYGRTGKQSFFRDTDGNWHAGDHQGSVGSGADPKIN